jgi:hypothetical protein
MTTVSKQDIQQMISRAEDWSWRIMDQRGGWGRGEGAPLAIIDSAELLYGLEAVGAHKDKIRGCVKFLKDQLALTYLKWVRSPHAARTYAWILLTFTASGDSQKSADVKKCVRLISEFKEKGKGWKASGSELHGKMKVKKGDQSNVYDTAISIVALQSAKVSDGVREGQSWLRRIQNKDGGWGFWEGDESNPVCTGLASIVCADKRVASRAINWLKENQSPDGRWYLSYESTPLWSGDVWAHFSTPLCVLAMIRNGQRNSSSVRRALLYLKNLESQEGGWSIMKDFPLCNKMTPFTWATGNVLWAFNELKR